MKIEIFGDGCPKCRSLEANVRRTLAETGIEADLEVVSDPERIAAYNLLTLPGLVIDGELKVAGKLLPPAGLRTLLEAAK